MIKRHAFTLIEFLTALALQFMVIILISTVLRWTVVFSLKTSKILSARAHAEEFILYLRPRVQNCGLGFFNCQSKTDKYKLRRAFGYNTSSYNFPNVNAFRDSLMIFPELENYTRNIMPSYDDEDGVTRGKVLGIIYTMPLKLNVIVQTRDGKNKIIPDSNSERSYICYIDNDLNEGGDFLDYSNYASDVLRRRNIKTWLTLEGCGMPLYALRVPYGTKNRKALKLEVPDTVDYSVEIPAAARIFYIRTEIFYVTHNNDSSDISGTLFRLSPAYSTSQGAYNDVNPIENGILEIYFELYKLSHTLDVYILSEGGTYESFTATGINKRPKAWPEKAHYDEKYNTRELYVTRASFKVDNVIF